MLFSACYLWSNFKAFEARVGAMTHTLRALGCINVYVKHYVKLTRVVVILSYKFVVKLNLNAKVNRYKSHLW